MKIKSKVDVITNSSTEIFTLRTSKSLQEVSDWLHENTSGFCEPEIMTLSGDSGVLYELVDSGYLVDPENQESMTGYLIKAIGSTFYYDEHYNKIEIEHATPLFKAWLEHLWLNKEELNRFMRKKYGPEDWRVRDGTCWEELTDHDKFIKRALQGYIDYQLECQESYPPRFIESFLDLWTGPRPITLELPEYKNAKYWVGKIGFSGDSDNSIPYEDFDKIKDTFDGLSWHMG
jgi:hypothetical protein